MSNFNIADGAYIHDMMLLMPTGSGRTYYIILKILQRSSEHYQSCAERYIRYR